MEQRINVDPATIVNILGTVGSPLIVISELIKNSIDAASDNVWITFNRLARTISVTDNGCGFSLAEILKLSVPASSYKKKDGNFTNPKGNFYTGSKGLGLLSVFTICENLKIHTTSNSDGEFVINWSKGIRGYTYEKVSFPQLDRGTIITLNGISSQVMAFLTSQGEINKLKHLTTYLYKNNKLNFPEITLSIDGGDPVSLLFYSELNDMLYDVNFRYDRISKSMLFRCSSNDNSINNSEIIIDKFDTYSIERLIEENYNIDKVIKTRSNDNIRFEELESVDGVPTFEGRIIVYEKKSAGSALKAYGAGVNIYVNELAMYNYLSDEFDWLGLADFSQRKKSTRLKPHNVFGYVNLPNFIESEEQLKISNERADFIQDAIFMKFMYLIKGVIMFIVLNIDVAKGKQKNKILEIEDQKEQFDEEDYNQDGAEDRTGNSQSYDVSETTGNYHGFSSENFKESEDINDNKLEESYEPINEFKPPQRKNYRLTFTTVEGHLFENLKNTDDLGSKIYQLVYELSRINVNYYPYSIVALYRTLIEAATFYASRKIGSQYQDTALAASIVNVLNRWSDKQEISKELRANIGLWRDLVNKRKFIEKLNLYIHNSTPIDVDLIIDTWKSMKGYIVECVK